MDQRVVEHYAGDFSKMNIYPKAKQKIQQKFAGLFSQSSSKHEDLT
jgi:alkane 1-monooxygenase